MHKRVQFLVRFVNHCLMVQYDCRQNITDVIVIGNSTSFHIVYPSVASDNIWNCSKFVERVAAAAASFVTGSANKFTHGFPSMGLEDLFVRTPDGNLKVSFIADIGLYHPKTQLPIIRSCTLVDHEPILLSDLNKFPCSASDELVSDTIISYSQ